MTERIRDEALAWDDRLKRDRSPATRAAFEAWLAADHAHRAEYAQFGKLDALLAESGARSSRPEVAPRRSLWPALATAAAAAVVLAVAILGSPFESRPGGPSLASPAAAQLTRPLRLDDGSLVVLGERASIEPHFAAGQRTVVLKGGPARFLVASNPRPLEIVTGPSRIRAQAGIVDIDGSPAAGAVTVIAGSATVSARGATDHIVSAGQRIDLTARTVGPAPPPIQLRVIDADGLAVADLIALANSASGGPTVAATAEVGRRRVTGRFDVSDRQQLARRLAAALGLRVVESPRQVLLTPG